MSMKQYEFWFVVGSQFLRSPALKNVALIQEIGPVDNRKRLAHVMVGDEEVARFTRDDSHVDNLAVGRFLMFGAHRAEIYEEDGEVGTGFFWVGDVQ